MSSHSRLSSKTWRISKEISKCQTITIRNKIEGVQKRTDPQYHQKERITSYLNMFKGQGNPNALHNFLREVSLTARPSEYIHHSAFTIHCIPFTISKTRVVTLNPPIFCSLRMRCCCSLDYLLPVKAKLIPKTRVC